MKKLFYLSMAFMAYAVIFFGPMTASADRVHVPIVYQYGASNENYSTISVKNLASEAMNVTVHFMASSQLTYGTSLSSATTHSGKSIGTKIPSQGAWHVCTLDKDLWGTTTNLYIAQVEVESSATNHPYVEGVTKNANGTGVDGVGAGPIAVNTLFISTQSAGPSGFVFPTYYRVRSWASTNASGTAGYTTIDNWAQ